MDESRLNYARRDHASYYIEKRRIVPSTHAGALVTARLGKISFRLRIPIAKVHGIPPAERETWREIELQLFCLFEAQMINETESVDY